MQTPSTTTPAPPQQAPAPAPKPDRMRMQMLERQLRDNQNFGMALLGGAGAAIIGALIWAGITAATHLQIGWMAVGVGFLVGFSIRKFGRGIDMLYGVLGACLSLLGCIVGNILTACIDIAMVENIPFSEVISGLSIELIVAILVFTFSPIDLLFYGLALYFGYKYSFHQLSPDEMQSLTGTPTGASAK